MKIVFMGTPDFAVPTLAALISSKHEVVGVYTQPDKPQKRSKAPVPPPVKELALKHGLLVFQPSLLRSDEVFEEFKTLGADIAVVVAYGQILPERIFSYPKYGSINGHASLLPKYRGAAPIQWAILDGEKKTGITAMCISKGMDEGDILYTSECEILENESAGELMDRLSYICADLLMKTVDNIEKALENRIPQAAIDIEPSLAPKITPELGIIEFGEDAAVIHNKIRGLNPWPAAKFMLAGEWIKVYSSCLVKTEEKGTVGEILDERKLIVSTGEGTAIELCEVQRAGKNRISGTEFMHGMRLNKGNILK